MGTNLNLVNNSQEIEEALDSLRSKYSSVQSSLASEIDQLATRINRLDQELERDSRRISTIKARKAHFEKNALQIDAAAGESPDVQLARIESRVRQLYMRCCVESSDKSGAASELHLRTIDMLTNFERKLRTLLSDIGSLDPNEVNALEKELK